MMRWNFLTWLFCFLPGWLFRSESGDGLTVWLDYVYGCRVEQLSAEKSAEYSQANSIMCRMISSAVKVGNRSDFKSGCAWQPKK